MSDRPLAALLAAGLCLQAPFAGAAGTEAETMQVEDIRFAGEADGIDHAMLKGLVTLSPGRAYEAAQVRESLANLYETGKFEAIEVNLEPARPGAAIVTFALRRARLITAWSFRGATVVDDDTLARALDLSWGQPLDRERFATWKQAIKERYLREGFPDAKGEFRVLMEGPGRADLEINVTEGEPIRIRNLEIDAAGGLTPERVRRVLGIGPKDRLERARVFDGVERVKRLLTSEGWVRRRVTWYLTLPDGRRETNHGAVMAAAPAWVDLHVAVDPGQQVVVEVDADPLLPVADLESAITVYERNSISPFELETSADKLKELYVARGYAQARVTQAIEKSRNNIHRVRFKIEPGKRLIVADVRFAGNRTFDPETLGRSVTTRDKWWFFGRPAFDPAAWEDDLANLLAFYESHGFLGAKVTGVERTVKPESGELLLTVHIDEGPRTTIGRILFPGLTPLQHSEALKALPVTPGDPYNPRRLPEWVSVVNSHFAQSGRPLARTIATVIPGENPRGSTLSFDVKLGPIKRVGRIVVRGNVKTQDSVVRRQIRVEPGDVYNSEDLFRTQQAIYQLGFFDRVAVEPIRPISDDPGEPVDLVVAVHERETGWLGIGGGYGLQQGPQVSAEFLQNNVWGSGRPLRVEGVLSLPRSSFQGSLRDPYLMGANLIGDLGISYLRERLGHDQPLVQTYGPTLGVSRQLSDALFGSLRYAWGRTDYLEYTADDLAAAQGSAARVNSVVTAGITFDTRSDLLNPRRGTKADISVDLATPLLYGSLAYARPRVSLAHYLPLPGRVVLAVGGEVGYIQPLAGVTTLPRDLLFLTGGANSLRGYAFNQVGVPGPDNRIDGGRLMAVARTELRLPIWGDFGGVAFVDAGDVWARPDDVTVGSLKVAAGLGARYNTPMGPVRVDYGVRIAPQLAWPGMDGLYLGLGHAF